MSLQRGMFKLYLETNRNTTIQIICKLILMGLMSKIEYLIMPKGKKIHGVR